MKNQVILIHPRTKYNRGITYPLPSLALAATLEKENFLPVIIDMEIEPDFHNRLAGCLDESLFIGISAMTDWQIKYGLEVCEFVRNRNPNIPIVWGGWHPTSLAVQTAKDKRVDIVVRGEGDFVVVELAKALQGQFPLSDVKGITYKAEDTIVANDDADPIIDLDTLPYTPWHLIDFQAYIEKYGVRTLCLQTGRGCPYSCSFCSHKVMPNRKVREFSSRYLFDNIENVILKHDISHVRFYEPTFIRSRKRAEEICQEIRQRGLAISWDGSARANIVAGFDQELLTMLKQSGCKQLNFGFESGSQRILAEINKKATVQDSLQAVSMCADHNIKVEGYFVRGFPSETFLDMLETDKMILELKRIAPDISLSMGFYTAYPGTPMYLECIEKFGLKEKTTLQEWGEVSHWENDRPWFSNAKKMWGHLANRVFRHQIASRFLYILLPLLQLFMVAVSKLNRNAHAVKSNGIQQ